MANLPQSTTELRLYEGIPWYRDYQATRWFDTIDQQKAYFRDLDEIVKRKNYKFMDVERNPRVAVEQKYDDVMNINYMAFKHDSTGKWFYAFVNHIEYENQQTTWVYFEIDVIQTYMFDVSFQPSYIERQHEGLWNDDGTPILNLEDEQVDYGDEMDTVHAEKIQVNQGVKWLVMIASETLHGKDDEVAQSPNDNNADDGLTDYEAGDIRPTRIGVYQPLSYYVVPFSFTEGDLYAYKQPGDNFETAVSTPRQILESVYSDESTVGKVVSIYITESIGIPVTLDSTDTQNPHIINFSFNPSVNATVVELGEGFYALYMKDVPYFSEETIKVANNKYSAFPTPTEAKLLQSPYSQTFITDFKGQWEQIKQEYIASSDLTVYVKGSLGTSNKISWGVRYYNRGSSASYDDVALSNQNALINQNPTDVPIISDMTAAFMQGNRNSREQQQKAINSGSLFKQIGATAQTATGNPLGIFMGASQFTQAQSDKNQQIGQLQAKKKDIDNQPNGLQQMGSNSAYDYGNRYDGLWIIYKQVKPKVKRRLEYFFHLYGYKDNRVMKPHLHNRESFNYVETKACNLKGKINNEDMEQLKDIFDSGITLWHINDVGNYDVENGVI